jgi:outer membrane protein assembly factor BamD (BamD/ComL family)
MAPKEYQATMFDRRGPDGIHDLRTWSYGLLVFGIVAGAMLMTGGFTWFVFPVAIVVALIVVGGATFLSTIAGNSYKHIMVSGASTPYTEQYSYQQSLVMKGEIDGALASFESIIAEKPRTVTARVKAAELYIKERKNHTRAFDLFREIQRIPAISAGDYVYATNRIVDLYVGPLNEPGKARVELRKLVEQFPNSPAATNARIALTELRSRDTHE